MRQIFKRSQGNGISKFFSSRFYTFKQINKKYSTPRIKTTKTVRISLLMLRIYLLTMVVILIYKFATLVIK